MASTSLCGAIARVAFVSGTCCTPRASTAATKGPGALTPITSYPASENADSCGPSSSSRLMSVVVTCTSRGRPPPSAPGSLMR